MTPLLGLEAGLVLEIMRYSNFLPRQRDEGGRGKDEAKGDLSSLSDMST